jgi:uncharacterized SAM-binding protein YcdF (DUF218 family)
MSEETYTPDQLASITEYVDVEAPPPAAAADFIPGTNQTIPVDIAAERFHKGLTPMIIVTGGVNRHTGINEGQEFRRLLIARGVNSAAIRCEDRSASTEQNVEFSLGYVREAIESNLPIAAICKWYHRRAIHYLRTFAPNIGPIYAITYEPIYSGMPITRTNWFTHPDGKRRVLREWHEVARRTSDGTLSNLTKADGAWR